MFAIDRLCAREYESRQEMAAASLAYKCMEVAYMRVVYCKNSSTNRDRHELQATLLLVPQGNRRASCRYTDGHGCLVFLCCLQVFLAPFELHINLSLF